MWREPMVVIGMVVIATTMVVGMIGIFAGEVAVTLSTILLAFAGTSILQLANAAKTNAAEKKAEAAVVVAEETRAEAATGRQEVKEELKNVAQALSSAEQSGVMAGVAGIQKRERNNA